MLIEFHLIQNHAPSNLNRDDTGSPKEAFFGGHRRARISSQCLKRSIRKSPLFREEMGDALAVRTRRLPGEVERFLAGELGCDPELARRIASRAAAIGSAKKKDAAEAEAAPAAGQGPGGPNAADAPPPKAPGKKNAKVTPKAEDQPPAETAQLIFMGRDEIRDVAEALLNLFKEDPSRYPKIPAIELEGRVAEHRHEVGKARGGRIGSIDIALFGRMTTSDAFEDVQASMQVAHALSTHRLDHEFDYYTAVDDLKSPAEDKGAGMIGDVEFNSSCYYKYFALDWTALLGADKLAGDVELGRKTVRALVRAAALTTPTGKQNSFAAHNPPDLVLVECKPRNIPVSYANAFLQPASPRGERDLVDESLRKLFDYITRLDATYNLAPRRHWISTRDLKDVALMTRCTGLDELLAEVSKECQP